MTEIYVVEYVCDDNYDGYVVYPIRAFRDEQKAKLFIEECNEESLRVDLEIEAHWSHHQQEYDKVGETIREKVRGKQFDHNLPEVKRRLEIMEGERSILNSHKYHPNYRANSKGQFVCEVRLELVE